MKKRNLFPVFLTIALTGILSLSLVSCNKAPSKNIGLQLYSVRDSIRNMDNLPGALAKIEAMGYKFVESSSYNNGKFHGMEPADFKQLCESHNLPVLSSHCSRPLPDSTNYAETMAWWDQCVDAHAALGVKYMVQPSMGRSGYSSIEELQKWCDYFNEVGAKCNAKGIRFGYHNHNREVEVMLDSTILVYDYMLQHTDPAKVFFQMDIGHLVDGGANPLDYFNKYPGRFEVWHIAEGFEFGSTGHVDWEAVWKAAATSGMKYGIVEVEKYSELGSGDNKIKDQFASCKVTLDSLNAAPYVVMPIAAN